MRNHAAATLTAFGAEVDHPVGIGPDVEVVLDDHHGVAGIHQPMQHAYEFLHIGHVQSDRGFIENVKRMPLTFSPSPPFRGERAGERWVGRFRQFGHQLDALRLAAGKCRALLAQGQVTQADVLQQP